MVENIIFIIAVVAISQCEFKMVFENRKVLCDWENIWESAYARQNFEISLWHFPIFPHRLSRYLLFFSYPSLWYLIRSPQHFSYTNFFYSLYSKLFSLYAELLLLHQKDQRLAALLSGASHRLRNITKNVVALNQEELSKLFRPEIVHIIHSLK